jgi:hypothetical protein
MGSIKSSERDWSPKTKTGRPRIIKRAYKNLEGEPRLPFVLSGVPVQENPPSSSLPLTYKALQAYVNVKVNHRTSNNNRKGVP